MTHPLYMWYYQDLTKQFEKKTNYSTPTDFEKFQLVNVANSISNKIDAMCQTVSCDEYPKIVKGYAEQISREMLLESPDYYEILRNALQVKSQINFAFYHHKIRDQRYYQTLYWVLGNLDYLYKIPKKYLFDLYEFQDFRHVIASSFVNYLMQYNNVDDLNFVVLESNHVAINNSAKDKNIYVLLDSSRTLFSKYYSNSYYKEINDRSANEFMVYIVNWFNNETYGHFKAYYAEQMNRSSRAKP